MGISFFRSPAARYTGTMPQEHTPKPPRAFQGIADPTYLLREIEELRDIALARPVSARSITYWSAPRSRR